MANAGGIVGRAAWNVVSQTLGVVSGSFAFILGLATAPVLIFLLNEGLRTDQGVPLRPLSGGVTHHLAGHSGYSRPDAGRIHPRSIDHGLDCRGDHNCRAVVARGALRLHPGHRRRLDRVGAHHRAVDRWSSRRVGNLGYRAGQNFSGSSCCTWSSNSWKTPFWCPGFRATPSDCIPSPSSW